MSEDLRQHPRIRAERLKVRVPDRAALEMHLRDISEGGLYLNASSPPAAGTVLGVELFAPGSQTPLPLSGKVVRVEADGFALKLDPLPEATLEQLAGLITSLSTTEPGAPGPGSLAEANARIASLQSELAAAREQLDVLHKEVAGNRAFLARALSGASQPGKNGPGFGHALFLGAGLVAGVLVATALMVLRRPEPAASPQQVLAPRPLLGVTFDAGRTSEQVRREQAESGAALFDGGLRGAEVAARGLDAGLRGDERVARVGDAGRSAAPALAPTPPASDAGRATRAPDVVPPPASVVDDSGHLTLTANAPAEVWLDGKNVGRARHTPVSVTAGRHQVRFDCLTDAGLRTGQTQTVEVLPFSDTELDFDCQ